MTHRSYAVLAAAAALATAAAAPAGAQQLRFGIAAGANIPTGDLDDRNDTGFHGTVGLHLRPMASTVGFRFEGGYHQFDAGTDDGRDFRAIPVTGNLVLEVPGRAVKPYVIAGAGLYNTKREGLDSRNNVGLNGGFGLRFDVGDGLATMVELRLHHAFDGLAEDRAAQWVPVSFGIVF